MVYKNNIASLSHLNGFEGRSPPMLLQKESASTAKLSESPMWENQVCVLGGSVAADFGLAADTQVKKGTYESVSLYYCYLLRLRTCYQLCTV